MGWGRMLLLGNFGQQMDIDDIHGDLEQMRQQLKSLHGWGTENAQVDATQDRRMQDLQRENDQLRLSVATLARLLVAKGVVSQHELGKLADLIDRED